MLRAGILGAGYIARAHANGYAQAKDRVQVVGVADHDLERAKALAQPLGAQAVDSLTALLALGVDLVSICVPTPLHAEMAMQALRAGAHVLCEKPIARSLQEAETMIQFANAQKLKLMVGHVSRFEVDHQKAREIVQRGDLGDLKMGFQAITGAYPAWGSAGWFADLKKSGGPVLDLAIHSIDYLLWLFNSAPVRVYAVGAKGKLDLHSYVNVTIRFASGAMALVESSWAHPRSAPFMVRTELVGTQGRLNWDYDDMTAMQIATDEPAAYQRVVLPGEDSFASEISDFVDSIAQNRPVSIPGEEALKALRVSLAALESLETGRAVAL